MALLAFWADLDSSFDNCDLLESEAIRVRVNFLKDGA